MGGELEVSGSRSRVRGPAGGGRAVRAVWAGLRRELCTVEGVRRGARGVGGLGVSGWWYGVSGWWLVAGGYGEGFRGRR